MAARTSGLCGAAKPLPGAAPSRLRRTDDVIEAPTDAVADLPAELRGTFTWDQGVEMSRHALFPRETGLPVYFCEPRLPWQRGSNENANGLLRPYFPKGTDLSIRTADLKTVARKLNTRHGGPLDAGLRPRS